METALATIKQFFDTTELIRKQVACKHVGMHQVGTYLVCPDCHLEVEF
jgi:hypothetical protein